jgi:hypothetical protein
MTKFASLRDYLAGHVIQKIGWNLDAAAAIRYSTEHPLLVFTPSTGAR